MMSDDDMERGANRHDAHTLHLEQNQHPDGYEDSAASLCRDSMDNEPLDSIHKTESKLSMQTHPASEGDSAMEAVTRETKDDVIVDDDKTCASCEMKGTKLDPGYFQKLEPTWDFMEGCSYDVQNYRTNGELSYIKDIQPSNSSYDEFAYVGHDCSDIDISCSFGNEYFLPLSQDFSMLKSTGSPIMDGVLSMKAPHYDDWIESEKLKHHAKRPLRQDSLESHGYDSIYAAGQESPFGTIESCGKSALLDHVRQSLGDERWDDPSLDSSLHDESSIDESGRGYLVLSEDDWDEDDDEDGGMVKAFRFVFGMGAFAALHLMK